MLRDSAEFSLITTSTLAGPCARAGAAASIAASAAAMGTGEAPQFPVEVLMISVAARQHHYAARERARDCGAGPLAGSAGRVRPARTGGSAPQFLAHSRADCGKDAMLVER